MKPAIIFLAALVTIAAGAVWSIHLYRQNEELEKQLSLKRVSSSQFSLRQPVASGDSGGISERNDDALGMEIKRVRQEIAEREKVARDVPSRSLSAAQARAQNMDPERGLTPLENLRNVGRSSPAAAVQTLFWALINGRDQVAQQAFYMDDITRQKADRFIASLSEDERQKWPTAESVEALAVAPSALNVTAIQISNTQFTSSSTAVVTVQGLTRGDQILPLHLGSSGWQLAVSESQMDWTLHQLQSGQ